MKIIVGETAGFCYGVERAVNGAKEELKKEQSIYGLGEIVHNQNVVKELEIQGMNFIKDLKEANGKVIVRAHGIPKETYGQAKKNNIQLIDYTCPKVLKIHEIAEEYANKGYYIFLLGSKEHPENIGTCSYCGKNKYIIEKEEDRFKAIENLKKSHIKKLLVIAQTTYSLEKFYVIEKTIQEELPKNIEIIVKNTICHATEIRQKETKEIASKVDFMIIIGGKKSSNTRKLYDIAKQNCKEAVLIENADDLNLNLIRKSEKIGIMAGASTPTQSIDEVAKKIENNLVSALI